MTGTARQGFPRFWHLAPVALVALGLFLLLHPYDGIIHDSRLYLLQALNYSRPELYHQDVFLKFGSQDSYTLFTPLFAAAVSMLGAEPAASLFTLVPALALLASGWVLVRTLATPAFAWLGVGLMAALPGYYGANVTFAVLEGFATPRMPAEALSLFAIAAWLVDQRWLAAALMSVALVIHPLMAFPVVVMLTLMTWGPRHWRLLLGAVAAGTLLAALALAGWLPLSRWQFDPEWWHMIGNTTNLLPLQWSVHDWARVATVLATLGLCAQCLAGDGQRLALALLATTALLMLLACVGGDVLRLVLVVQGQAWRVLWLATAVALLLLPWTARACWQGPPLRRAALLLLASAWIVGHLGLALMLSVTAVLLATIGTHPALQRLARVAMLAAAVVFAVTSLAVMAEAWTSPPAANRDTHSWLALARQACSHALVPAALLAAAWRLGRSPLAVVSTLVLALPFTALAATTGRTWAKPIYPQEARAAFASWRELIPPGSDVLWATRFLHSSDPATVWLLLERPSFYSSVQANSGLFSRAAAMELRRRGRSIPPALPTEMPFTLNFGGEDGVPPSCSQVPARYIVTDVPVAGAMTVPAPQDAPPPFSKLQLRVCPERDVAMQMISAR
jgi:hypothetical protein